LAGRLLPNGKPIPLIAETGGQNAMIVDSSALAEQVVADVIASAFDSAGQRCSALRVLCLQEAVADRTLAMLKGALHELSLGCTDKLATDIGPVISVEAKDIIESHIEAMRAKGKKVEQIGALKGTEHGTFVAPTIIEINSLAELSREVFGPVLHVLRYRRADMNGLIDQINATGYGLTFGLHTRLDETIAQVTSRIKAGNLYINRNVIGAVVGVQPFGGRGLSGTGPKAGGPLYLGRLVEKAASSQHKGEAMADPGLLAFADWLDTKGEDAQAARRLGTVSRLGQVQEMPGPVGERNLYLTHPRGRILLVPKTVQGLYLQLASVLATGNSALIEARDDLKPVLQSLPDSVKARMKLVEHGAWAGVDLAGALLEASGEELIALNKTIAALPGPLLLVQAAASAEMGDTHPYCLDWLVEEVSISTNTAAAGGNASLMAIG
jgi:RHH-type transcriptional regulator, proline utilization regulon repressor / proline dehydrogenase / delta 1-pyrroline-5-carboxylate dehydrogenase